MRQTNRRFLLLILAAIYSTQQGGIAHYFPSDTSDEGEVPSPGYNFHESPPQGRDKWDHFVQHDNQPQPKPDKHVSKSDVTGDFQLFNAEILYHLDLVPCPYAHMPQPGQTRSYNTRLYYINHTQFHCWSIEVFTNNIKTSQGSDGPIYRIQSENYGQGPYYPRRLQYFNLDCPNDGIIHSMTTNLEEQLKLTVSHQSLSYCVDYVHVRYKQSLSSCQLCGNETVKSKSCEEYFEEGITVTFRSSQLNNFKGFKMDVICYNANEQNLPGCIPTLSAQEESKLNSLDDSNYYYQTPKQFLPNEAEENLMEFYTSSVNSAHTFSAEHNQNMLRMAILSERSCNAVLRAIGRGVTQLFPAKMVIETKMNVQGWEYV